MTVSQNVNRSFRVGELLVEPATDRISRHGKTFNLRRQVMDLLVFLAENQGDVVSIEELLDTLWPGKVVTDGTLYNCIGELRHAVASLDDSQPYIENIPKKGYRLLVTVERPVASPITLATASEGKANGLAYRKKIILALVSALVIAVMAFMYRPAPRAVSSIAVLPFEDISPRGDQAYLGNGVADELRLELQGLDGLNVTGRTSSIAHAQKDSNAIADILNVDAILEGSIRKEDGTVRITAQLTDARNGFTIWSKSYSRSLENIFEMQEEIATSVAGILGVKLGMGDINAFRGAGTRNLEAYDLYLQTQTHDWTKAAVDRKIRLLERAVELDPGYAAAWSMLGNLVHCTAWDVGPEQVSEIVDKAYPLVLRGVRLNPESATAQSHLAAVREARLDWFGAEQSHRRAIELLPDRLIVEKYAFTLMRSGRTEAALKQYAVARALEPADGMPSMQSWHAKVAKGRFAEAREKFDWQPVEETFEDDLDIAFNEPDPEKLKAAIRGIPDSNIAFTGLYAKVLADFESPERIRSLLWDVYQDEDLQWIRKLHDLAMLAVYFGDPEFALRVKGEEVRVNVLRISSLWYPVMSEVRRLPEFKQLVTDLNLVEYWRSYGWADACQPLGNDDFECS